MKKHILLRLAIALLSVGLVQSCSAGKTAYWDVARSSYYLTEAQQSVQFAPPPADGSEADKADLATMMEWQLKRTPEQCAKANAESHADFNSLFGDVSPFPKPMPAKAAAILKKIKKDTDSATVILKDRYARQRPFRRDSKLEPCLGRISGLSYPSGHAAVSRVFALVLSELQPERRAEFMAGADQAALYRVIGGVHHPSDIEAGKKLGDELFALFMKTPSFVKDLETLRGYVKKTVQVK